MFIQNCLTNTRKELSHLINKGGEIIPTFGCMNFNNEVENPAGWSFMHNVLLEQTKNEYAQDILRQMKGKQMAKQRRNGI